MKAIAHSFIDLILLGLLVLVVSGCRDQKTSEEPIDSIARQSEAAQFDFWIGEWDLTWEGGTGTNRISWILNGHVIKEEFDGRPSVNLVGQSYSVFEEGEGLWKQTWVDNQGGYLDFNGGFIEGKMVLERAAVQDGKKVKQRMIWHNIKENSLTWNWEMSEDGGKTWMPRWIIHYTRRK